MISYTDAQDIVLNSQVAYSTEKVMLNQSLNRILAKDVLSDVDMPPFNKSAMDGFACRKGDLSNELKVIETIKAGDEPKNTINKNECSRIMTGASVPEGADCVIMVEQTEMVGDDLIRFTADKTADNIALKGEDLKKGEAALKKGTLIKPQHIAVLASVGCIMPEVFSKPKVAVLTTGDEIVEPHHNPGGKKIRNSNGSQLIAQLKELGIDATYFGIIEDTPQGTKKAIKIAIQNNDIILLTGGVSMGDYDFVPGALEENGVDILFSEVAIKPGKPTVFGRKEDTFVFGLPGNPVSSFVIFELFVKPFIYQYVGYQYQPRDVVMQMGIDYSRKKTVRTFWMPVFINENNEAMPVEYHGSAHIHSMCYADGLAYIETGKKEIRKGGPVHVRLL